MRVLVVGGHSRNIGKTSLAVDLIRAFPEAAWTAVKITQYGHGVCSIHGEHCGCAPDEHAVALDEEHDRNNRTDTSRFLVAGAARSLWMRCKQGHLAGAMPQLRAALRDAGNVLLESNTVLRFLKPELYLVVLDPEQPDFKDSARFFLDRADGLVLRTPLQDVNWPAVSPRLVESKTAFFQPPGAALPGDLIEFVRRRFFDPETIVR
jgi:hypothetical protein